MDFSYFLYIFFTITLSVFFLIKLKPLATYLHLIDDAKDKIHQIDTPKFGFFLSIIILFNILLLFFFFKSSYNNILITIYIFSFSFIGYLDDRYDLSVKKRFFLSLIITSIFFFYNPNNYYVSFLFNPYVNYFLLIFFTLGFIHLVNISDGINGLVPSLFLYSCLYYLFKGYPDLELFFQVLIVTSAVSISIFVIPNFLGLCFLGNSGSYLVSILISLFYMDLYSINILEYSDILLIFYIPLIDGLRVTFMRIFKGVSPFKGDFTHIHHLVRKNNFLKYIYFLQVFLPSLINFFFKDFTIFIAISFVIIFSFFYIYVRCEIKN